jgi:hypothetical protein
MMNDTYRFGVQVQWKDTGKWSAPYWVDDIRFDTLADNVNSLDDRRTGNNIDTNLTNSTGESVNIYYVKFGNINLNYLVDGVPLRDLIQSIRFVRAERIQEVLATGYFFPGASRTQLIHTYTRIFRKLNLILVLVVMFVMYFPTCVL